MAIDEFEEFFRKSLPKIPNAFQKFFAIDQYDALIPEKLGGTGFSEP